MPIRIKKDKNYKNNDNDNYPGRKQRPSGGNNPIVYFLPMIMKMFGKNPKLLLIVGALAAVWYFFGGGATCNAPVQEAAASIFSTGASFDDAKYAEVEVYEPLADNIKNPLPEKVSLLSYAPKRLNQGKQGSCVGWASAYAARTILYSKETGKDPNSSTFSPSFLYNQIALDGCQGTYLPDAMKTMQKGGVAPFSVFRYDESSCSDQPDREEMEIARNYKIVAYDKLTKSESNNEVDMLAIKQHLASGAPVVIGMMVGGSFMQDMHGENVWLPSSSDYNQRGFGGHAMCVIGYDDYYEGGAFQIMNSWGEKWGNDGVAYVRYKDFDFFTREAFGIYSMGDADAPRGSTNHIELGLWLSDQVKNVPLTPLSENVFRSEQRLSTDDSFKIEVENSLPCYVYVFGKETDGSSYVLFPYTEKHSPYCGITGTRHFPRDFVMYPDETPGEDEMAVVVSAQPIDYNAFNDALSRGSGAYSDRLTNALSNYSRPQNLRGGELISADINLGEQGMWGAVIRIPK